MSGSHGWVPSDTARSNSTVNQTLVTQTARAQTVVADTVRANRLVTSTSVNTVPVAVTPTSGPMQLTLDSNQSVYIPFLQSVQLQASIFLGNPPAAMGVQLLATIPPEFAPPADQYLEVRVPSLNSTPPIEFDTLVSLRLTTSGEIFMLINLTVGYAHLPIQFFYRLV